MTRQACLLALSDALRPLADPVEVQAEAARVLGEHLRATRVFYGETSTEDADVVVERNYVAGGATTMAGRFRVGELAPMLPAALRFGRTVVVPDVATSDELSREERAACGRLGISAILGVPIAKEGRFVGHLVVHQAAPRSWTPQEVALVEETAERTLAAIERVRAEAALRDSEERYRALFTAMEQGYCLVERLPTDHIDFRFVDANPAFSRHTGLVDVIGKTVLELVPDIERRILERCDRVVRTCVPERFEAHVAALDLWVDAEAFPSRASGQLSVLFSNVSSRKLAERARREGEAQHAFLLQLSDALRPLTDPASIEREACRYMRTHLGADRVRYWHAVSATEVVPAAADDAEGTAPLSGTYRLADYGADLAAAFLAGRTMSGEDAATDVTLDERQRAAFAASSTRGWAAVPLVKDGRLAALFTATFSAAHGWTTAELALLQHVAERTWTAAERARAEAALAKAHETALHARAVADQANRAKDDFLAMLGHEVRNPLTTILATLDVMRLERKKAFSRERELIERQARHLARLVDDLLDVTRVARGKVKLVRKRIELAAVVERAMEGVAPLLRERRHRIVTMLERGVMVHGDEDRFVQIATNLVGNAAKYAGQRGLIEVIVSADANEAVLRVRDDGEGIARDLLPHVFDPFRQGKQGIERSRGGLGLGLAIVRNLVELHGGTVGAHSEGRGKGSEFVVRIPLARRRKARVRLRVAASNSSPATEPLRVLIVDDNRDIADTVAQLLRARGHVVEVAYGASAGLMKARKLEPHVALLDIGLPRMDGYELARRFRDTAQLRRVRLVAVTGYGQPEDRRRALRAGFDEHLVKPIDLERLTAVVEGRGVATRRTSITRSKSEARTRPSSRTRRRSTG